MHFTRSLLVALAAPLAVWAQNEPNPFTLATSFHASAGETVKLTWTPTTEGTVSLSLRSGNPGDLDKGTPIASSIDNSGSYTWHIPSATLNGGTYTVEIVSDSNAQDVNYSGPFAIQSTNVIPTSSSASSSATAITSDSSSSPTPTSSTTAPGTTVITTTRSTDGTSSTGSQTGSTTSRPESSTSSQADLQASSTTSPNSAARATAMVGMLGAVALGALAL